MMLAAAHEGTGPRYATIEVDREARLPAGARVAGGDLEIVEELARGGMSVVYRALDHRNAGREVALKIVTAEVEGSDTAERFRNEARLGAMLADHPHVVSPLRVGQLDGPAGFEGRMYLVTELVEGASLDDVMGTHRVGLAWRRACTIARDVARALVDLHACGIVHRDIKPGNVLLTREPNERARLIDFGLAYATGDGWAMSSPDLTQEGHAPGTVLYMSPQQVAHERPAPVMDIYALGVMLYELFSGNPPYHRLGTAETLARKCDPTRSPYPLATMCPELDERLCSLVHRCLDFEADSRPDADEVVRILERVLGVCSPCPVEPTPTARRRRRWLVAPAAAALVIGGGAWWLARGPAVASEPPVTVSARPIRGAEELSPRSSLAIETSPAPDQRVPAPVKSSPSSEGPKTFAALIAPATDGRVRGTEKDEAPSSTTASVSPPRARRPGKAAKPPPVPAVARCPEDIREIARSAHGARKWRTVVQLTGDVTCWAGAEDERVALRTRALFESQRFAECARVGQGSKDPSVMRWARICEAHGHEDSP